MSERTRVQTSKEQHTSSPISQPLPVLQVQQQPTPVEAYQHVRSQPRLLAPNVLHVLQRTVGNRAVQRLLGGTPQRKGNTTSLPESLKAGAEALSGISLDDVHVHYNSSQPAQMQALAYTKGTDIHVGPGQERYLAHEAWHVVQQKQGRVVPTVQAKGVAINDDAALEREADVMGERAARGSYPEKVAQMKMDEDSLYADGEYKDDPCDCAGPCTCGGHGDFAEQFQKFPNSLMNRERVIQPMRLRRPSSSTLAAGVIQMRECSDGVNWSARTPGQNAAALRLSGMLMTHEEAHVLCCAFCKAQIQSLANTGPADPALPAPIRYTALFRHYVPIEQAAAPLATPLHLEESYFIGVNAINDSLLDVAWWNAIRVPINAGFFTGPGVYPAGLPVAAQATFNLLKLLYGPAIPVAPPPALPAGRRSYNLLAIVLFSGIYSIAKFLEDTAPVAAAGVAAAFTVWGVLRNAAGGHARSSDVTIDRAAAGGAAASSSILDAKFSYPGGAFDAFQPNQEADLLRAHAILPGAGAGVGGAAPQQVATLTSGTCGCARHLFENQKRETTRSRTSKGPDQASSRTRGGQKRMREERERQSTNRKQLRFVR